ncbi:MAG TPA: DUF5060 domain-containing protein [Verrucomicrobiales bacterium]|nr:DUF5060 domain-containing protein [Verrucomicrobiales bacterium]
MNACLKLSTVAATGWLIHAAAAQESSLDRAGFLWSPHLEWILRNPDRGENPFDLEASVAFTHAESGERRTTGMFHDGGDQWKFRFTATRTGTWSFETRSGASALDGKRGSIVIAATPVPAGRGFITSVDGTRWAWQTGEDGDVKPFVPQLVMARDLSAYRDDPGKMESDIQTWIIEHGFNGIHLGVLCRWFDFDQVSSDRITSPDPNPDPRTFEVLEQIIARVHGAGGMVHIWMWGDDSRRMTPVKWGINGTADQRLQRYIAARLGPLPGWTMSYGFDLWEWVDGEQLAAWRANLHGHFGWPHLLGGRWEQNRLTQATETLDYASYEQHRPSYEKYLETIGERPGKPAFSEDRFRVRDPSPYPEKDYDLEMTRRGLWHSTLAGGVANIWGYLVPAGDEGGSRPYPNRDEILTYSRFFQNRFVRGMRPCNERTAYERGVGIEENRVRACFGDPEASCFLFYAEDAETVRMDLRGMEETQPALAVDALKPYRELALEPLDPKEHEWKAPYKSTWAVAVGRFP